MPSFTALPLEIRLNIIRFLDFPTLIALISTNHYHHNLDLKPQKRAALLDLEQRAPGTPKPDALTQLLIRHTHLPCYICFRFLGPSTYFELEQTIGARALGQHQASRRRCVRCISRKGIAVGKGGTSVLVFRNGCTYIECVSCREVKRYVINDLHEQAWARGQSCMECWWFRKARPDKPVTDTDPVNTASEWISYDSKRLVRVPVMDGKTAAMLLGEISLRISKVKPAEFQRAVAAIKAAVKLPNIRVSKVEEDTALCRQPHPPAYSTAAGPAASVTIAGSGIQIETPMPTNP